MGQTFVYNAGVSVVPEDELNLTFGLFFDGTLNNRENTRLRKKYRTPGEDQLAKDNSREEVQKEEKAVDEIRKREDTLYKYTFETNKYDNSKRDNEYLNYLEGSHRGTLDKLGVDNSFSNDYTNVARMSFCCDSNYTIYIEGIGTLDNTKDTDDGFQYGSGITGVRGKVRKGCEMLADKINEQKRKEPNKVLTQVTVDVFGFSRGAAAARNFVYEVNAKPIKKAKDKKVPDGYYPMTSYTDEPVQKYKTIFVDTDGKEVQRSVLKEDLMPRLGHLGYKLLEKGIMTQEEVSNLSVKVRFVGVYDTVSSYEEFGDMGTAERVGFRGLVHATLGSDFNFGDDVEQLQLNNMGRFSQAVHFTAQDEHRENFDLTRMISGVEKNLPGVHCDIGGAYETGMETVDEIEVVNKHPGVGFNSYSSWNPYKKLDDFRKKLITDYWYQEEELVISTEKHLKGVLQYTKLTGTRFLKKEYSYIPLHFMAEFCVKHMSKELVKNVDKEYSIAGHDLLEDAKKQLHKYVFDNSPEWNFQDDATLKKKLDQREAEENMKKLREEWSMINPNGTKPAVADNTRVYNPKVLEKYLYEEKFTKNEDIPKTVQLEEVVIYGGPQGILRKLRNQYLHWSANRDWMGMDPRNDRKRVEH